MVEQSGESTLDDSTYNILAALGTEADFLHSTINTYISDAQKENKTELVNIWNTIKQDKMKHMEMLKNCLETEVQKGQLKQ